MRRFIGSRFFVSLTALVVVAALAVLYVSYCKYYWQQNTRLLRTGWNMMKLLRQHNLLMVLKDVEENECPSGACGNAAAEPCTIQCESPALHAQARFYADFCDHWATRAASGVGPLPRTDCDTEDADMLRRVSHVPIEYSQYVQGSDELLAKHWHQFVSGQCANYYDKLICLNGLVFDWSNGTVRQDETQRHDEEHGTATAAG